MLLLRLWIAAFFYACFSTGEECASPKGERDVEQLFDNFWEWKLVNNPEFATTIGIFKYDDRVNELSLSSFKRRESEVRLFARALDNLKQCVNVTKNPTLTFNMDLLESDLQQFLSGTKFNTYVWPMSIMEGPQNDPSYLLTLMKKKTASDVSRIITRIRLFSQQIEEQIALLNEGIRIGQTLHRKSFESLITIFEKIGTCKIENNPFFKPFLQQPEEISDSDWRILDHSARLAVINYIRPAFRRLGSFMKTRYLPHSRPKIGLLTVPNGRQYYQALLQYHTTTTLSPKEVHKIGLTEVNRINKRMVNIKNLVRFNGTLDQFRQYLRTDKKFGFKDEKDMLDHYENIRTKVVKALPKFFGILPKSPFVIKPVPADIAPQLPAAYYMPSVDKPGTFFLNTYKHEIRRRYAAEALFLHEALPGHHLQIALKIENGSPVMFRRYTGMDVPYYQAPASFSMNSAYTEGWGLYAEYLGEEMGIYEDPYMLFGRLSAEMLRACRLVVDTGMHSLGWNRTTAMDFMIKNTAIDLHNIEAETDRYISVPGQACAYKIGELKIKQLRSYAESQLRGKFDIRKFHDFILAMGNIPLTVLEKQVKLFIENEKKN